MFAYSIEKAKNFIIVVAVRSCAPGQRRKRSIPGRRMRRKEMQGGTPLHEVGSRLI